MKRKTPDGASPSHQPLVDAENVVLNLIKNKKNLGIWLADIKKEAKQFQPVVIDKSLASLVKKNLIKQVKNIQSKTRKHFMAVEFEPSEELTGGVWYTEGNLDKKRINDLKESCLEVIKELQVTTAEGVSDFLNGRKEKAINCTPGQISEILRSMVLDNTIIEVKSTGLGEYHSIPFGATCYRNASTGPGQKTGGAMASIPCGVCPRISECTLMESSPTKHAYTFLNGWNSKSVL